VDEIQAFVTGALPAVPGKRLLVSVLSVEIEGPSSGAGTDLIERHAEEIRRELLGAEGRRIRRTASGFVAVFQGPTRSIQCAIAIRQRLKQSGLDVRSAVHTGECEQRGDDFSGMAIELSSRLLASFRP
jgi:class 3 adenylate cyclase